MNICKVQTLMNCECLCCRMGSWCSFPLCGEPGDARARAHERAGRHRAAADALLQAHVRLMQPPLRSPPTWFAFAQLLRQEHAVACRA